MISRQDKIINLLVQHKLSDRDIANRLNCKLSRIQMSISWINLNNKKYKKFSIVKTGKYRKYIRELITKETDGNDIFKNRDRKFKKGLKQFDSAKKDGVLGINTREGIKNRNIFMQGLLQQNLNVSIEAQKLLQ